MPDQDKRFKKVFDDMEKALNYEITDSMKNEVIKTIRNSKINSPEDIEELLKVDIEIGELNKFAKTEKDKDLVREFTKHLLKLQKKVIIREVNFNMLVRRIFKLLIRKIILINNLLDNPQTTPYIEVSKHDTKLNPAPAPEPEPVPVPAPEPVPVPAPEPEPVPAQQTRLDKEKEKARLGARAGRSFLDNMKNPNVRPSRSDERKTFITTRRTRNDERERSEKRDEREGEAAEVAAAEVAAAKTAKAKGNWEKVKTTTKATGALVQAGEEGKKTRTRPITTIPYVKSRDENMQDVQKKVKEEKRKSELTDFGRFKEDYKKQYGATTDERFLNIFNKIQVRESKERESKERDNGNNIPEEKLEVAMKTKEQRDSISFELPIDDMSNNP